MIDKKFFYLRTRALGLFSTLSQDQVKCIDILIDEWDKQHIPDERQFAYLMATAYHETFNPKQPQKRMTPVTEFGSETYLKSKKYYPYIGRGFVQITWKSNYLRFTNYLGMEGIDLIKNPDYALIPSIAAKIAVYGMVNGKFTGLGLSKFFNATTKDYVGARRIINGNDCAEKIAEYAIRFYQATQHI